MKVAGAPAPPCRSRSARYAVKGYPNYAEDDECREPSRGNGGGGDRAKDDPSARSGRKRGRAVAVEPSGKFLVPILQGEEAVMQEEGRKRRVTDAAATAVSKMLPLTGDGEEGVSPTDGGGDVPGEVGGDCKSWRQRVKETLRAFSTNYLHFVQEEQQRSEAFIG